MVRPLKKPTSMGWRRLHTVYVYGYVLLVFCFEGLSGTISPSVKFPSKQAKVFSNPDFTSTVDNVLPYRTGYFRQPIDHFGFQHADPHHANDFNMRFLYNLTHWKGKGSPVLFYTGNEGEITTFWNNCGFIVNVLSKNLNAALIFAESRYFGESKPFGKDSLTPDNAVFLTVEQTLEDYANFILYMLVTVENKGTLFGDLSDQPRITNWGKTRSAQIAEGKVLPVYDQNTPIIAVGGSYGGMLATWMRMKYPHFVTAALAASAPVLQYRNVTDEYGYFRKVTKSYLHSLPARQGQQCVDIIRQAMFGLQTALSDTERWWGHVKESFNLCHDVTSIAGQQDLIRKLAYWYADTLGSIAMVNYPYPTDFLVNVPGWPAKKMCEYLVHYSSNNHSERKSSNLPNIWKSMRTGLDSLSVLQSSSCLDVTVPPDNFEEEPWNYLTCTSQVLPTATNGKTDMFPANPFDEVSYSDDCYKKFDIRPDYYWMARFTGISFMECSNIVFTNGKLDPWSGGGILTSPSASCPSYYMDNAAHHLDLRSPHPEDPSDVVEARQQQLEWLQKWIEEFHFKRQKSQRLASEL